MVEKLQVSSLVAKVAPPAKDPAKDGVTLTGFRVGTDFDEFCKAVTSIVNYNVVAADNTVVASNIFTEETPWKL